MAGKIRRAASLCITTSLRSPSINALAIWLGTGVTRCTHPAEYPGVRNGTGTTRRDSPRTRA